MHQCKSCQGFVPSRSRSCPNCQAVFKPSLKARLRQAFQLVMGASVTMTLAACYGIPAPMPSCNDAKDPKQPCETPSPSGSPESSASPAASPSASASPQVAPSSSPAAPTPSPSA